MLRLRKTEALSALGGSAAAVLYFYLGTPWLLSQADPLEDGRKAQKEPKILFCKLQGRVDSALVENRKHVLEEGLRANPDATFIVFEIDSTGGELEAAHDLAEYIFRELRSYRTVAWVPPDKLALAEAVLPVLAANEIVMGKDSKLGADLTRKGSREEETAKLREWVGTYALQRGKSTALAEAMVAPSKEEIFAVAFADKEKDEFLTRRDRDNLSFERKGKLKGEPRLVLKAGELLVMSNAEATKYRFSSHAANDRETLKTEIGCIAGPENTIDVDSGVNRKLSVQARRTVDLLNHPVVRFLLLLVGCLGVLVELKAFGTVVPGTIALASFAVFYVAGSLGGTASSWEILLFVLGLALITVEFFLLPGIALFAVSGAALCGISLVLAMVPPSADLRSQTLSEAIEDAIATLAFGFGAGTLCFLFLLRWLPHNPIFARRGLVTTAAIVGVPTADTALAAQAAANDLVDRKGTAATTLRPSGRVEMDDGRLLDVVAEGEFIEKGTRVRVIRSEAGINVVARLEEATEG